MQKYSFCRTLNAKKKSRRGFSFEHTRQHLFVSTILLRTTKSNMYNDGASDGYVWGAVSACHV